MFRYKSIKEQFLKEKRKVAILTSQNIKQQSDIDYLAMMCDVELEVESKEGQENEQI